MRRPPSLPLSATIATFVLLALLAPARAQEDAQDPTPPADPVVEAAREIELPPLGTGLPEGAVARLGSLDLRMANPVGALQFLDDTLILAAGADPALRLWDATSGKEVGRLPILGDSIRWCTLSPDGRTLHAVARSGVVARYDTAERGTVTRVADLPGLAIVAPDGSLIVAASTMAASVELYDGRGSYLRAVPSGSNRAIALALSRDQARVAVAGWNAVTRRERTGVLRVVRIAGQEDAEELSLELPDVLFHKVMFLPDDRRLAAADSAGTLRIADVERRVFGTPVRGHEGAVTALAASADGASIATGGADGRIALYHGETGQLIHAFEAHSEAVFSLAFSPDGTLLASGGADATIRLWDPETGERRFESPGHAAAVRCAAVSGDGSRIATGGGDGSLIVWDGAGHEALATLTGSLGMVNAIAFQRDGGFVVGGLDGTLGFFAPGEKGEVRRIVVGDLAVTDVDVSPDGRLLAVVTADNLLRLLDARDGALEREIRLEQGLAAAAAFSRDGSRVAAGTSVVSIWNVADGSLVRTFAGPRAPVADVVFSADGKTVLSANASSSVSWWDVESGEERRRVAAGLGRAAALALSPDGRLLVTAASGESGIRLWDAETGEPLGMLEGHAAPVQDLVFAADGRTLVSTATDRTALIWRTPPLREDD